jgi:hypothetical protein
MVFCVIKLLRHVVTNVSEEYAGFIFRVEVKTAGYYNK